MFVADAIPSLIPNRSRPATHKPGLAHFWLAGLWLVLVQFSGNLQAAEVQSIVNPEQTEIVYLNTATVQELKQGLVGVGQHRAEAIVAYRQRVGDFRNDDELSQVKGIGPHVLTANKARISYAPSARPAAANSRAAKRSLAEKN